MLLSDIDRFMALDCETTGVEPGSRIVEIAAIEFDTQGHEFRRFYSLVQCGMPLPRDAGDFLNLSSEQIV